MLVGKQNEASGLIGSVDGRLVQWLRGSLHEESGFQKDHRNPGVNDRGFRRLLCHHWGLPWRPLLQRSIAVLTILDRVPRSNSRTVGRRTFRWRQDAGSVRPTRRLGAVYARAG